MFATRDRRRFSLRRFRLFFLILLVAPAPLDAEESLTLYCGRSKNLVAPVIDAFEKKTGIKVRARYGNTAQLTAALLEEGQATPADIFWAQDAGALGAVTKAGLFLPDLMKSIAKDTADGIPAKLRNKADTWVPTSGRARVLAYSSKRVSRSDLPGSVFDLTDPKWKGRVGWAPTNASFQAFVTAMRVKEGEAKTRAWLLAMKANDAQKYPKNTPILAALAAGEIDLGLPNHYYLLRFQKTDPNFPVAQTFFSDKGDVGNLVNVAGVGVLRSTKRRAQAVKLVNFLLSDEGQKFFTQDVGELPVRAGTNPPPLLRDVRDKAPDMDLDSLDDLQGTLKLLRETGLL